MTRITRKQAIALVLSFPAALVAQQTAGSHSHSNGNPPMLFLHLNDGKPDTATGFGGMVVHFGGKTKTITAREIWEAL